jgi:hypothetical protein
MPSALGTAAFEDARLKHLKSLTKKIVAQSWRMEDDQTWQAAAVIMLWAASTRPVPRSSVPKPMVLSHGVMAACIVHSLPIHEGCRIGAHHLSGGGCASFQCTPQWWVKVVGQLKSLGKTGVRASDGQGDGCSKQGWSSWP